MGKAGGKKMLFQWLSIYSLAPWLSNLKSPNEVRPRSFLKVVGNCSRKRMDLAHSHAFGVVFPMANWRTARLVELHRRNLRNRQQKPDPTAACGRHQVVEVNNSVMHCI